MRVHTNVFYWLSDSRNDPAKQGRITACISGGRFLIDFKHLVHGRNIIEASALKPVRHTSTQFRRSLRLISN